MEMFLKKFIQAALYTGNILEKTPDMRNCTVMKSNKVYLCWTWLRILIYIV